MLYYTNEIAIINSEIQYLDRKAVIGSLTEKEL
jgi:hypothetical protein